MNRQIKEYADQMIKDIDDSEESFAVLRKMAEEHDIPWNEVENYINKSVNRKLFLKQLNGIGAILFLIFSIIASVALVGKSCSMLFSVISG